MLTSVFVISVCGIMYELLISTLSSYFQGSSILHFSLVIGLFLSFMGVGSYLSRYIRSRLLLWFIRFEIWLSLVGGISSLLLYMAFSLTPYFYVVVFVLIALLGTLIGLEIPLLTRIVRGYENLREAMAKVLSFDYLGALIASVLFPLVLLPLLGIMRTAFATGLLNLLVAVLNVYMFREELSHPRRLLAWSGLLGLLLAGGLAYSFQLSGFFERFLYQDEIMLSRQSAYQQIVVTRWNEDVRLFLNGNLQFSSRDEYRYHEPLVHLPVAWAPRHERVLILGGGDGLAAREVLRYPAVQTLTLVDLDPEMTRLGQRHPVFTRLNAQSLNDPRVEVRNEDAYRFLQESSDRYNVVIIDLPDPHDASLGKLYSTAFYRLVDKHLSAGGVVVTQATSPYFAPTAYWCIVETMRAEFGNSLPYTTYVPSFGQWGFCAAVQGADTLVADSMQQRVQAHLRTYAQVPLRYLGAEMLPGLFLFDGDMRRRPVEINRLEDQLLVQYYEQSLRNWR
ncbi:MAG: polyamine aminopropyltransferase [Bacteroidia bacterium]